MSFAEGGRRAAGMTGLHARLRMALRPDHDAAEAAQEGLDLAVPAELRRFLLLQRRGFARMTADPGLPPAPEVAGLHAAMLAALARDLRPVFMSGSRATLTPPTPSTTGARTVPAMPEAAPCPAARPLHPDALAYLLLGARLGAAVQRHWLDPAAPLPAWFSLPSQAAAWRVFCARLAATPAEGPDAERILADCRRGLALFLPARETTSGRTAPPDTPFSEQHT